jgi:Protein of unknown function (DUF3160)
MRRRSATGPLLALAAAVALAVSACGGSQPSTTTTPSATTVTLPVALTSFGEYQPVPLLGPDTPAYAGPATPHSLARVTVAKSLAGVLKAVPGLEAMLAKQGFAVVRSGSSLFQDEYEGNRYGGYPLYVTTDAAFDAWHLAFDKILRDLEQKVLLPKLERLVTGLRSAARAQASELRKTALAGDASRVVQIYELAAAELGLPGKLGPLAAQERALIAAHDASAPSPLLGETIDYSLFTPRGHYTLTPALTRFFLGMSVLEQLKFCLPGTEGCPGVEPARIGILASTLVADDSTLTALWHDVYDPTSFLVGLADDYTPGEVAAAAARALPATAYGGTALPFASDADVEKVVRALVAARPVRIDPRQASMRIMGTRFTTDEFILDQLVYPHVGTEQKPRLVPSGLDLASAFGSTAAAKALAATGGSDYASYDTQLRAVQAAVAARAPVEWGSTVNDAWLAALQPLFAPHGKAFPDYMRTDAWAAKDLQTGLGSYTELKHDTILFAKQLEAEAGGEVSKANPRNWVEPDPVAFERLAAAADLLQQGLGARGLLSGEASGLLSTEIDLFRFLGRVAGEELAGAPLAAADNERLRGIGDELSAIWWRTSERAHPNPSIPDQSALVADIASSPKGVVELATGDVDTIYVLVPGDGGTFELARGGVYSYYEFLSPPGERLDDAAWRALLERKPPPARPAWESVFRVACPPAKSAYGCSPSFGPG